MMTKAQIIAAAKIARGGELAGVVDEFVRLAAKEPGIEKVQLDVAKHGGARIHSFEVDLEGDAKDKLGDGLAHLAIREDSVFFALGGDSLAAVKSAIDKMGQPGPNRPPVSLRVSLGKLVNLFGSGEDPGVVLARQAFAGGGDEASIELVPIERGARLRVEFGEGVFRLIGLAAGIVIAGLGVVGTTVNGQSRIAAFIELTDGVRGDEQLADELRGWCKQRMRRYEYPHVVRFTDQLPRTLTGKVQRFKLRELAREGQ